MKLYVGNSGYSYKEWKGIFYPEKLPAKEMLRFYAERLGAVEINNTFYRMPAERVLVSWADQVPADFIFAFKAPRIITHIRRLKNVEEETGYLLRTLTVLGKRLGPVLFQFPASFRGDPDILKAFLTLLPAAIDCAFELRSRSRLDPLIQDLLREKGCSLCTTDSDDNPASEIISTAPWGYLRLRRTDYTEVDLEKWRDRIFAQKWEKAFLFFKHEDEAAGPGMALKFRQMTKGSE